MSDHRWAQVLLAVVASLLAGLSEATAAPINEPWSRPEAALVLDAFEGNAIDFDQLAKEPRVVAIIYRASIGLTADKRYSQIRAEAKKRGYLWGSFHLAMRGHPVEQAELYLRLVGDPTGELLALDLESPVSMTVADIRTFLRIIEERTGRLPTIYGNHNVVRTLSDKYPRDPLFSRVPLWYARFRREIPDFPTGIWTSWTLWQFSSELVCTPQHPDRCPIRVPGTLTDIDVNVYQGSRDELKASWPF